MPKEFVNIPKEKTPEQALSSLMNLCAKAEKSSGDALRLMYKWGVKEEYKQEILNKLIAQRFIDDNRYAQAYVREKTNLSGWGAYKIRVNLQSKGIAREIINEVLSSLDQEKMRERLKEKLIKKSRSLSSSTPDRYKVREKIIRYGISLGYDYGTVKSVSNELNADF